MVMTLGKTTCNRTFDALEWLAAMCSHVPNLGEQMVRYYGHYSNVKRDKDSIPCTIEEDGVSPENCLQFTVD